MRCRDFSVIVILCLSKFKKGASVTHCFNFFPNLTNELLMIVNACQNSCTKYQYSRKLGSYMGIQPHFKCILTLQRACRNILCPTLCIGFESRCNTFAIERSSWLCRSQIFYVRSFSYYRKTSSLFINVRYEVYFIWQLFLTSGSYKLACKLQIWCYCVF